MLETIAIFIQTLVIIGGILAIIKFVRQEEHRLTILEATIKHISEDLKEIKDKLKIKM